MNTIPKYRSGPIIEEPSSDDGEPDVSRSGPTAAASDGVPIDPRRVEEIEVELDAIALPQTGPRPRVTLPGQKPDAVAKLSIATSVCLCYGREAELMAHVRELLGDGLSWQEVDEAIDPIYKGIRAEIEAKDKLEMEQWRREQREKAELAKAETAEGRAKLDLLVADAYRVDKKKECRVY
ncbi:MAG: hypothetical protein LBB38_01570 [Puniceicoccales bacterium]|jgi:hypothetical protein|nr:hypothetical protein [Puniceicoccales bacterium]